MSTAPAVISLLDRPAYSMAQVDRLLLLHGGTARRWIDGYHRGGKRYPPVVRIAHTGDDIVTWGEFVETRLLSEYRHAGVPMLHMRPAVDRLREQFDASYPLAHAKPFVAGRELVLKVQADVKLDRGLHIVVVRNDQVVLTDRAEHFWRSADFDEGDDGAEAFVHRLRPIAAIADVLIDPLRQFGEPVVRSVRTDVIAEQVRAGESLATVSELFELSIEQVEAAVRYELRRSAPADEDAA